MWCFEYWSLCFGSDPTRPTDTFAGYIGGTSSDGEPETQRAWAAWTVLGAFLISYTYLATLCVTYLTLATQANGFQTGTRRSPMPTLLEVDL